MTADIDGLRSDGRSDAVCPRKAATEGIVHLRSRLVGVGALCVVLSGTAPALVPGDVNCDGRVDGQDVDALVALLFGSPRTTANDNGDCSGPDVNGDGSIDLTDLLLVLHLLPTATPTATPVPREGPAVTFVGLAGADGTTVSQIGTTAEGTPIFQQAGGSGFQVVVEAMPG